MARPAVGGGLRRPTASDWAKSEVDVRGGLIVRAGARATCHCEGACPGRGSQRAYARHRGCYHRAVQVALRDRRIELEADGKIEFARADASWNRNTDVTTDSNTVSGNPRAAGRRQRGLAPGVNGNGHGGEQDGRARALAGLAAAKARHESYDAKMARIKYEQMRGQLVRVEEVQKVWFSAARRARDMILAIPSRISSVLAGEGDPAEVHRLLTEELRRACQEIGDEAK